MGTQRNAEEECRELTRSTARDQVRPLLETGVVKHHRLGDDRGALLCGGHHRVLGQAPIRLVAHGPAPQWHRFVLALYDRVVGNFAAAAGQVERHSADVAGGLRRVARGGRAAGVVGWLPLLAAVLNYRIASHREVLRGLATVV